MFTHTLRKSTKADLMILRKKVLTKAANRINIYDKACLNKICSEK